MQVLPENSERPVSKLAETNGLIDWLDRDEVDVEEVQHLARSGAWKEQESYLRAHWEKNYYATFI